MGQVMLLGRGEEATGGRERQALLCGAFEALIGAIYLDSGLERVMKFMESRLEVAAEAVLEDESLFDARSLLQIWAQAHVGETPRYRTVSSHGPDHAREFVVEVSLQGKRLGEGRGHSKQEAAQGAASEALSQIEGQTLWFDT
jgi:ribonuclease-3